MLQDVRVEDPTSEGGERRPEHQPGFRAGLDAAVPFAGRLRALGRAHYTGRQFCVDPELGTDRELDGSGQVSLGLERSWPLRSGWGGWIRALRASLWADNVGDNAVYDQCGLPQPGRTFRLQVQVG